MNARVARDLFPRIRKEDRDVLKTTFVYVTKVHLRQKSIYEMDKQYYVSELSGSVKACESFRPGDPYQEWRINPTAANTANKKSHERQPGTYATTKNM